MCHLSRAPHAKFPLPLPPGLEIEAAISCQNDLDSPGKSERFHSYWYNLGQQSYCCIATRMFAFQWPWRLKSVSHTEPLASCTICPKQPQASPHPLPLPSHLSVPLLPMPCPLPALDNGDLCLFTDLATSYDWRGQSHLLTVPSVYILSGATLAASFHRSVRVTT